MKDSPLIRFYDGRGPDDRGRYLAEILQWPDERLEAVHDFIQWMFPLRERSGVNPTAPLVDDSIVQEFRSRPELRKNLQASLLRMIRFYGLEMQHEPNLSVKRAANFRKRSESWLTFSNHNHLRLTRIIKSLRLLGLEQEANALFVCLAAIYHSQDKTAPVISAETFRFWRSAAA